MFKFFFCLSLKQAVCVCVCDSACVCVYDSVCVCVCVHVYNAKLTVGVSYQAQGQVYLHRQS